VKTLFSILRTPPSNQSEDVLHCYILHQLTYLFPAIQGQVPHEQVFFDFVQGVTEILQRNLLPFLLELTASRTRIVKGVLHLFLALLPFHEVTNQVQNIRVLNKFHLDCSSQACILRLTHKYISSQDDHLLIDLLLQVLLSLVASQPLSLALDIRTSPQA
jgi:hypothetical protein